MLSKRLRLPIKSVTSRTELSVRGGGLTLKVFTNNLPYGRFGVIVPKAVAQTAVLRNKLKRSAFDAFSAFADKLAGHDTLCIVAKGAPLTKDGMMKELSSLLSRINN